MRDCPLCNLFCCCGDQNTRVKLFTISLFFFSTHLYKATSRKKVLIPIQAGNALQPIELGRDWHYLLYRQPWSWKLMPNLPENPGSGWAQDLG